MGRTKKPKATWEDIKANPEKLKYFRQNFAKNGIRRMSYRWPGRYNRLNQNKLARNEYFCDFCGMVKGRRDFQIDHHDPVVPVEGFDNFDLYIERMLCVEEKQNVLCLECHVTKSISENEQRRNKKS